MQYTDEQKAGFKVAYSRRRQRQLLLSAPLVVAIVAASIARESQAQTLLGVPIETAGPIFLVLMLAAVVFSFRNWRCPACDTYLGRTFNPRHCPSCGVELHA